MAFAPAARPLGETLNKRQKQLLLFSLMLAMFVSALNQSVVATATPKMLADLGGFSLLSWVFTVYMLTSTVITPLVGKLSDMFGRKNFLLAGIVVFVLGSAGCGFSTNMPMLIAFRGFQGIGGGMIMACVFTTLGDLFPPAERGKYIGFFTGTFTVAGLSGPSLGGLLTDHVSWRWVFFVNIPVAIVAMSFIWANLPSKTRRGKLRDIDFIGAGLLSGATTCLLLGLAWAQREFGWSSPQTAGLLVTSVLLVVGFVFQESRHREAVLPLAIFRNREFVMANMVAMTLGAGSFGAVQYLPTFVQTSLGASATSSGLVSTPQSLGMLFASVVGGQMISRLGRYRTQCITGTVLVLIGVLLMQTLDVGQPQWHIMAFMGVMGLGSGLVMPTMSVVSQNAVSHELMGVATSARQFFMQIGNVLGVAVFGVVLASSYRTAFVSEVAPATQAAIPPALFQRFDDPTLALNERQFDSVKAEVLQLENGEALLEDATAGQRSAVAVALRHIFLGSALVIALSVLCTIALKELPLRRGFEQAAAPARPGEATSGGTVAASAPSPGGGAT